jgi:hypothetical protein
MTVGQNHRRWARVFATMRRKSRNRRMKNEFGQSVDHFRRAASLAAQETSATVGPTLAAAVDRVQPAATKAKVAASSGWESAVATLAPLVSAATQNARQTSKATGKSARKAAKQNKKNAKKLEKRANAALSRDRGKRRGSRLLGLALIGTAVGMGAAYAAKRRRAAQWDEYDPAAPLTATTGGDATFEPTTSPTPTSPNGTLADPARQTPR